MASARIEGFIHLSLNIQDMSNLCPIANFTECKKETCAWWSEYAKSCSVAFIPYCEDSGVDTYRIEEKLNEIIEKIK
jgi:hypothetical protein